MVFIAASIVSFGDLTTAGSEQAAKSAGKVATVGKDYVMQPDDIVVISHKVVSKSEGRVRDLAEVEPTRPTKVRIWDEEDY